MQASQPSHVKFNDAQVNLGVNEDVITKEEFEFQSTGRLQKRLKLLRKISIVAIILSLYQLIYGGLALYYSESTFSLVSTLAAATSLILSITTTIWSTKAIRAEFVGNMFGKNILDGSWENFNSIVLLAAIARAASSLVLIPNMLMLSDSVSEDITSQGVLPNGASYETASRILSNMATLLPLTELFTSLILVQAARTISFYLKDSLRSASRLVNLSNVALFVASLGLIRSVLFAQSLESYSNPTLDHSTWSSKNLLALGTVLAVISPLIWLLNYKRWRIPSLTLLAVTLGVIVTLATFTASPYIHREEIENSYKGTEISYSEHFLAVMNFGLISIISGLVVIGAGLFFWRLNSRSMGQRSKKEFAWIALIAVILALFFALSYTAQGFSSQTHDVPVVNTHDQWFGGSGVRMSSDLTQKLTNLIVLGDKRYVIMRFDENTNQAYLVKEGEKSENYQDLLNSLDKENPEIALFRTSTESQGSLFGLVWIPSSTSDSLKLAYLKNFAVDKANPRSEVLGFPVHTAFTEEQLQRYISTEESLLFEDMMLFERTRDSLSTLAHNVKLAPKLTPGDAIEIYKMLFLEKYKYVVLELDDSKTQAHIEAKGTWDDSYDEFVRHFKKGQAKVGLIYLEVENQKKLVAIILEDGELAGKRHEFFANHGLPNLDQLAKAGILPYIAQDTNDLKLEKVLAGVSADGIAKQEASLAITTPGVMSLWSLSPHYNDQTNRNFGGSYAATFSQGNPSIAGLPAIPSSVEAISSRVRTVLVGEMGFSLGSEIFKMLTMNKYKYLIAEYNTAEEKPEILAEGDRGASYSSFVKKINPKQAQVSLIYLNFEGSDNLVLIIYAPATSYNDPSTVYQLFGLPVDPYRLEMIGLKVFVARKMEDLKFQNVMNHLFGDHNKMMNLIFWGSKKDAESEPEHKSVVLKQKTMAGLGEAGELLETVVAGKHKYIILKYNPLSERIVLTHTGDSDNSYDQFVQGFHDHEEQIGLIYLELEQSRKPVLVTFSPRDIRKDINNILYDFDLPENLETYGVSVYPAHTKDDLSLKNVLRGVYTNVQNVTQIMDQFQLLNLLNDEDINLCESCHANSHNVTDHTHYQLDESDTDSDYTDVDDYDFADIFNNTANTNFLFGFGNMGLRLKRDIIKPIKSKQLKYIILRRDAPNQKVYIAKSGTWFATFDQFAREFEPNQPQVGFIYLEIEGLDRLAMVVYAPSAIEINYLQVLKDFDVTKNPAKLSKKGISTCVVTELSDLTLDNTMRSVFAPGLTSMMMLTELVADYTQNYQDMTMFTLSNEAMVEMREMSRMTMLNSLGLKLKRDKRKLITNHKNKYVVLRKSDNGKNYEIKSVGSWHATLEQFAREFDPVDQQLGFIYLELEGKEKLVTVLFSPYSYNATFTDVFKSYNIARNAKKLQRKGVALYVAREQSDLQIDRVLNSIFNNNDVEHGANPLPLSSYSADVSKLPLPADIADAINNKKYKYVIFQHNKKKNVNEVTKTGDSGASHEDLIKQVRRSDEQLIFTHLNLESKHKPILIVFARKTPVDQVLTHFNFPDNVRQIESLGLSVYYARNKKDLEIFKLLQGIYTNTTQPTMLFDDCCMQAHEVSSGSDDLTDSLQSNWESMTTPHSVDTEVDMSSFMSLYTDKQLPFGKDVLDAINNKKFKFLILEHQPDSDKVFVQKFGKWSSTFKDFQKGFSKKTDQIGLIHITVEARDLLVLVVYSLKSTATVVLRQFKLPGDLEDIQNLGFRPYVARSRSDIDLVKVLKGVYNPELFLKSNQALFISNDGPSQGSSVSSGSSIYLDAFKMMATKKYRYMIIQRSTDSDQLAVGVTGDWNQNYNDFLGQFNENKNQVGLVYVGTAGNERLVFVVFAPSKLGQAIPDVAKTFNLPKNPRKFLNFGCIPYIAHDLEDLQESRVAARAYSENVMLVDTSSLISLWSQDEDGLAPRDFGYSDWTNLFSLQEELKRKVSDLTVDDDIIDAWNEYTTKGRFGYTLINTPEASVRLHALSTLNNEQVTYNDFLSELGTKPFYALVFTHDLVEKTGITEPILFEWKPTSSGLVEKTLSRDRLNPLAAKLNEPFYIHIAENKEEGSLSSVAATVDHVKHNKI